MIFKYVRKKVRTIISFLNREFFVFYKGFTKRDLLIYDDIFPHPVSGFRVEEFSVLLTKFNNSKIITEPTAYPIVKTPKKDHKKHVLEFLNQKVDLKNKIKFKRGFYNINAKLFYCIFLSNVFKNLIWLEKYKIPFVFTLYPGGGFRLNDPVSDQQLKEVLTSSLFRKVIVTQRITRDYLVEKKLCSLEKIEFIFGGVVPQISLEKDLTSKRSYLNNKNTFDICFCAAKYTLKGDDKGYDVFIECANRIAYQYDFVRFHVVGGFEENDIDVSLIKNKITFYGYQNFEALGGIYQQMDVLISPNKAFVLSKGAFDGFPLGTVVEAVLNGVVVLLTDELKLNSVFKPDEEIILIDSNSESILEKINYLIENPEKMYLISKKGRQKFLKIYSNEIQMKPRIAVLENEILNY